jgi:hypothetical protein
MVFDPRAEVIIGFDRIPRYRELDAATLDLDFGSPNAGTSWLIERISNAGTLATTPTGNERVIVFVSTGDDLDTVDFFPFGAGSPYIDPANRFRAISDEDSPIRVWENERVIVRLAGAPTGSGANRFTTLIQYSIAVPINAAKEVLAALDTGGLPTYEKGEDPDAGGWNARGAGAGGMPVRTGGGLVSGGGDS